MGEEQTRLLTLRQGDLGSEAAASAERKLNLLARAPAWSSLGVSGANSLERLTQEENQPCMAEYVSKNLGVLGDMAGVLSGSSSGGLEEAQCYTAVLMSELCRLNSSFFTEMTRNKEIGGGAVALRTTFLQLASKLTSTNAVAIDACVHLATSIMTYGGQALFGAEMAKQEAEAIVSGRYSLSEAGKLDAINNLLKNDDYRTAVWAVSDVQTLILTSADSSKPAAVLYKAVFSLWLLAYNQEILAELRVLHITRTIKQVLVQSRVEKVVRVALQTVRNCLNDMLCADAIVEENMLQAVLQLQYEKWRDAELYDELRDMEVRLLDEVKLRSNFERYERELGSGRLAWGFVHGEKFWMDNATKFDRDHCAPIKALKELLVKSSDPVTRAVACHDLGEFARFHPIGKKLCTEHHVKPAVMVLMSNSDRDVAREALLCVQKMMLQHWQDASN